MVFFSDSPLVDSKFEYLAGLRIDRNRMLLRSFVTEDSSGSLSWLMWKWSNISFGSIRFFGSISKAFLRKELEALVSEGGIRPLIDIVLSLALSYVSVRPVQGVVPVSIS